MSERGLDFDLGEMADTIRETTQRFAARQDRADRRRDRREGRIPAPAVAADGRARAARHHRRGGGWRARPRLSRACRRAGGSGARLGLGRPQLRRPLEPLRQPDPPLGQRRAEAQIPAQADQRRACRRAGDERGRRGQRRRRDEAEGREESATATASTAPSSGSPTAPTPTRWWSTPRPARAAAASPPS